MQAKLDICLWLGEYRKSRDRPYLSQLPPGYEPQYENDDDTNPPIAIVYEGRPMGVTNHRNQLKRTE